MAGNDCLIHALGTRCSLLGYSVDPSPTAARIFRDMVQEMEHRASRFRKDSELCLVFDGQAKSDVELSELLFDALEAAIGAARATNGYLDPTVAGSLESLGYVKDFARFAPSRVADDMDTTVTLPSGYMNIRLNPAKRSVSVASGVRVDLGATGKAFLADRIRRTIESDLGEPVLVNLGGDISASRVSSPDGWPVLVTDDRSLDASSNGSTISIFGGGVATSSTLKRAWEAGSGRVHHIIDPFSGTSARSKFDTVTVLAGSCFDANLASTATIAMGEAGPAWLSATGLPAMARNADSEVHFGEWKRFCRVGASI